MIKLSVNINPVTPTVKHDEYECVLQDVLHVFFDEDLLAIALQNSSDESRAHALYIIYKLARIDRKSQNGEC